MWLTVDGIWPREDTFLKKSSLIVRPEARVLNKLVEDEVFPWHFVAIEIFRGESFELSSQRWWYFFISVNDEYPVPSGFLKRKVTGWLDESGIWVVKCLG